MKRKKPIPKDSSFVTHSTTPPPDGTLLASFQQIKNGRIRIESLGDGCIRILGDIDQVRWKESGLISEAVKSALVRIDLAPTESLTLCTRIDVFQSEFVIGYELWAQAAVAKPIKIRDVQHVAKSVLKGLTEGVDGFNKDLFNNVDGLDTAAPLTNFVQETLKIVGGKKISSAIRVVVGDQEFKVARSLHAKPDYSNFHPVPETLTGKFTGFDIKAMELFLETEEKRYVLNFARDQVKLGAVTDSIDSSQECSIRTHRTTDRKGNYVYAYLPDAAFKHS
ncbi:MAG: hypothetical protein ACREBU_16415 [Nitrososphaera sp.]